MTKQACGCSPEMHTRPFPVYRVAAYDRQCPCRKLRKCIAKRKRRRLGRRPEAIEYVHHTDLACRSRQPVKKKREQQRARDRQSETHRGRQRLIISNPSHREKNPLPDINGKPEQQHHGARKKPSECPEQRDGKQLLLNGKEAPAYHERFRCRKVIGITMLSVLGAL